jgi:hypothetical protein
MWSLRHTVVSLFFGILAATWLFGCRAFEPEAVIVNKPPETYIIGSPAETTGTYFHYHVYWYGTDEDGVVDRFVWALTDTSIQDPRVMGDEEDENFNPATNISTLSRGHWTARTDSVFDFRINQGSVLSADMTLHMVAVDDRGDFDRTPARLHFFSNALGSPEIQFYRNVISPQTAFADYDTIAFREPLVLVWSGRTLNTTAYEPELLARADTVPAVLPNGSQPDGLLGFKWFVQEGNDCDPSRDGCWSPRRPREPGSTDSVSFFADTTALTFRNDGSGMLSYGKVLPSGILELLVNTIDVAGVQIPVAEQALNIVVNYDPDTYILRDESPDPDTPGSQRYPYYVVFHGPEAGRYTFSEGDTVPDGAYVMFMALGWDNSQDRPWDPCPPGNPDCPNRLRFQGSFRAVGLFEGTSPYQFSAPYSEPHQTEDGSGWTVPNDPYAVSRDTLGFEVGPFAYEVEMRTVDNHDRRDGTPDSFSFQGNFPPCVQCIELVNAETTTHPTFAYEDDCYDQACLTTPVLLRAPSGNPVSPTDLSVLSVSDYIWVDADGSDILFTAPVNPADYKKISAKHFGYVIYLHGKNPPQEHWPVGFADRRIAAWYYQVDYAGDQGNVIRDGGGIDYIRSLSGFNIDTNNPDPRTSDLFIVVDEALPYRGVWGITVTVGVPLFLQAAGPQAYWDFLLQPAIPPDGGGYGAPPKPPAGSTPEVICAWQADPAVQRAYRAWKLTTMQFTPGTVQAVASDASRCAWRSSTSMYHYFAGVRVPSPNHGRDCQPGVYNDATHIEAGALELAQFPTVSNDGVPVTKSFQIEVQTLVGDFQGGGDPPGWISCGKRASKGWR